MASNAVTGSATRAGDSGGRIVIVGASLAGLHAAEALRAEGFAGDLTLIGDEPYEPYDRPPLTKWVLVGRMSAGHAVLPRTPQGTMCCSPTVGRSASTSR